MPASCIFVKMVSSFYSSRGRAKALMVNIDVGY